MMNKKKWIKFLVYGMIGAVLTMIGDCLLLGVDTREAVGSLGQYIVSAQKVSYTRIGLAGSFGYVGIPLTAFGFYVLYLMLEKKDSMLARLYRASVYGYIALGGAIHIICCYLLTGMKKTCLPGWMWIINPLTFKILFNAIGKLGDSAFLNGLACSNMSLGDCLSCWPG